MNLRQRLAAMMIALIAVGSLSLAWISLAVVDRTLRAEINERLSTLAYSEAQIVDDNNGRAVVDADDVAQMNALLHADEHVAVVDRKGRTVFGELVPTAPAAAHVLLTHLPILHPKGGKTDDLGTSYAWQSENLLDSFWRTSVLTFAGVTLVLAAVAVLLSRRFADAILTPVERVAYLAEKIESNDLSQRLGMHGKDELGRLCASFDRMLERLQASFESERRFVADASHELRAPLSVVRAETDLALRRDRTPSEYRCALESIDRETSRLESLVDQLLGTLRESALIGDEFVDVGALARDVTTRMGRAASDLRFIQAGSPPVVRGHAQSIERALTAVLHNAVTHGGGTIGVQVIGAQEIVRIDVSDTGAGFSSDALAHATERFWRADSARSRGGTGLGLAIARVLIEAHGGEVLLGNGRDRGAVVSLVLPMS